MKVPVQSLPTTLSPTDYNQTNSELETAITSSGQTTSASDLTQVKKAVSNYVASGAFYGCTNVGDAYTLTPVSPFEGITSYKDGQLFRFRPSTTNTTQSPTINVNGQGVKNITKADGSTQVDIGDIDTNQDIELRYDLGNDVFVIPKLKTTSLIPTLYIGGISTENDAGDTQHDIKFNIGSCRDIADTQDIILASALVKQLDAVWTAGTGLGGRASAVSLSANTTYHMFVIAKPDGTVDAGFDTALNAVNLLSDATGYTKYRRVWSMDTDASSNWIQYIQTGKHCFYKSPILDYSAAPSSTATLASVTTPTGVKTLARYSLITIASGSNVNNIHYVSDPDGTDQSPTATYATAAWQYSTGTSDYGSTSHTFTNTSAQLRIRSASSTGGTVNLSTQGFYDPLIV